MNGPVNEGDRVSTPDGLGTVTKIVNATSLFPRRDKAQISVLLDDTPEWIKIYSYDELEEPVEWPA